MKKVILMASAVLMSAVCLGQVANVKKAQSLIFGETPDFDQARKLIFDAQQNVETQNDANTWYVAGLIGYQESENELYKMYLGQPVDYAVVGEAQRESYLCWQKADELAQILVQDKKGNMVMDKKNVTIRKNIAQRMLKYWENQGLLGYGVQFNDNQEYAKAYDLFNLYVNLPKLPVMQDEKTQAKMVRDTIYQDLCHSTAMLAYMAGKYEDCAAICVEMVKGDYKAVSAGEYLYSCYLNMQDSAKAYEVMDMCIELFPNEQRFLQARINSYVAGKQYDEAVALLDRAIAQDQQAQYYNSKGSILTIQGKYDEAAAAFKAGLEVDPNNAELYTNYGYVFVEKGNKLNDETAYMKDAEYNKARKEIDAIYKQALPLFQRAYELNKDNYDCVRALRSLYYRLGMMEEYNSL